MTVLNGHFDGQRIILDQPVPTGIPPHTPVRVVFDTGETSGDGDAQELLEQIGRLAVTDDGLPSDFAEQHEHYVKGAPRR
jgi:hypothetical protein